MRNLQADDELLLLHYRLHYAVANLIWVIVQIFDPVFGGPLSDPSDSGIQDLAAEMFSAGYSRVFAASYCMSVIRLHPKQHEDAIELCFHMRHAALASWSSCLTLLERHKTPLGPAVPLEICNRWVSREHVLIMLFSAFVDVRYDGAPNNLVYHTLRIFGRYLDQLEDTSNVDASALLIFGKISDLDAVVERLIRMCSMSEYTNPTGGYCLLLLLELWARFPALVVRLTVSSGHISVMKFGWGLIRQSKADRPLQETTRTLYVILMYVAYPSH